MDPAVMDARLLMPSERRAMPWLGFLMTAVPLMSSWPAFPCSVRCDDHDDMAGRSCP